MYEKCGTCTEAHPGKTVWHSKQTTQTIETLHTLGLNAPNIQSVIISSPRKGQGKSDICCLMQRDIELPIALRPFSVPKFAPKTR